MHYAVTMSASYSLKGTGIQRATVRRVAVLAESDERSVCKEIRAQLGHGSAVRGLVGERIRTHLRSLGLPPAGAQLATRAVHTRKKSSQAYD